MRRVDIASVLNISASSFDEVVKPRMPAEGIDGHGRNLRYDGSIAHRVYHAYLREQAEKDKPPDDADPLMTGGNSPNLERYRKEKADAAAMDNDERRRNLLPRFEVDLVLTQVAHIMRDAVDFVQRNPGCDAVSAYHEALDDVLVKIERALAPCDPDPGLAGEVRANGASAAPADDARVRGAGNHRSGGSVQGSALSLRPPAVRRAVV